MIKMIPRPTMASSTTFSLLLIATVALLLTPLAASQNCTSQTFASNYTSCQDLPALRATLHWTYTYSTRNLSVAFTAPPARPNGWIAWALNPTGTGMAGAQSLIAFRDTNGSMVVRTYNISSYSSIVEGPISYKVLSRRGEFSGGVMRIFATLVVPSEEPVNQIWQVGSAVTGGMPARHDFAAENLAARSSLQVAGTTATVSGGGRGGAAVPPQGGNENGSSKLVSLGDTLRQGDTLNSTSKLVTRQGYSAFTLEFYILEGSDYGYIAIWSRDLYPSSPVWIYNRDNSISGVSSATMMISSTGSLVVTLGNGDDPIELYTGNHPGHDVTATLQDSGNFVLRDNDDGIILWQSFDYPTDTLLPGMKLGINHKTGRTWSLTSWFGESNPASGPFTLVWDTTTHSLLVRRRGVLYWSSGELRDYYVQWANVTIKTFQNMNSTDGSFNFTIFTSNDEEYLLVDHPVEFSTYERIGDEYDYYRAMRLDYGQGDLSDDNGNLLAAVRLCSGYNTSDFTGCQLWQQPECRDPQRTFAPRSGHLGNPYLNRSDLCSFSDCRVSCWNECECVGFKDTPTGCLYWSGTNLKFEPSDDGSEPVIYVLDDGSSNNSKGSRILIWKILAVIISALLLLVAMALILARRSKRRKRKDEMNELLTLEGYTEAYDHEKGGAKRHDLRMFSYASIAASTNDFSQDYKLGEGGFGPVYKGQTAEGHEIAVKLLSRSSGQGLLEFKTELILISKLQHVNLVKLVGFCVHREDKMIVYDYMPNKSLDFFLFDQSKRVLLDWDQRFNIIQGIAQGLLYLHKYSRLSIVHRDLKCSNILLDENLNPKISDFGLARIFKQNTDEANTNRRVGTFGYMAPEYAMQGIFSFKSDVYSFGVLVLELVSGRKNTSFQDIEGPLNLVEYAWELWYRDSSQELMDPTLSRTCNVEQLKRCINVGLLCVEHRAADRPDIEDVVSMFKHETIPLPPPQNPAFITRNNVIEELGKSTPDNVSVNELSISQTGGR